MIPKSLVKVLNAEHGNVVQLSQDGESCPRGVLIVVRERRWRKKRMAFCSGVYTGSSFAQHESELTFYPGALMQENPQKLMLMKEGK